MQTLLDIVLPRTLDGLLARFGDGLWAGARLEAWLFEDEPARREAERALRAAGVEAVLRSACKPLLHAFLEEGLPAGPIALPAHPLAAAGRFCLESYPLAGLMTPAPAFLAGGLALDYVCADGLLVFAPNRVGVDAHGRAVLACCGWLRVWRDGAPVLDEALETEFEQAFAAVMAAVAGHGWPQETPCFPTLHVAVRTGGICRPLGIGHECVDTREALHEDLYFSLLELFQARFERDAGDRTLQPGQIVPEIMAGEGPTHVCVTVVPQLAAAAALGATSLEGAERALDAGQVDAALAAFGGERFIGCSVQGREVAGMYRHGTLPGLVVTAGQHANETSGVVGLLRAAEMLLAEPGGRVALVPLENPDGYAVHRLLCASAPRQMHHAARYTALGDDLEARRGPPWHETAARRWAWERADALLHISLHGYPAQEWTRPLSGYVPAGFGGWTLPCGFFLILRHHAGLEAQAMAFLQALTLALSVDVALMDMNRAQLALQTAHGGGGGATPLVLHGIACRVSVSDRSPVPFTLITEYPDETITGPAFVQAHEVQRETVIAAARLLWRGLLNIS